MAKHRRRPTARRNLLLVAGLVILFGGAAVGVRWFHQKPVRIMPPLPDPAPVADEDNAFVVMVRAAEKIRPHAPLPDLVISNPEHPERKSVYDTEVNSLARIMKVMRPDDDPMFLDYLQEFEPLAAAVREALAKPALQIPKQTVDGHYYYGANYHWFDPKGVLVLGAALARFKGKPDEGVSLLLDLIRLSRRARQACPTVRSMNWLESEVSRQLRLIAQNAPSELLEEIQREFEAMGRPIVSRRPLLEDYWRYIDALLLAPTPAAMDWSSRLEHMYATWRLRRVARFIIKHQDEFYRMVERPPGEVQQWFRAAQEDGPFIYITDPVRQVYLIASSTAYDNMWYAATVLVMAIERWRRDHDGACPDNLEALVPTYLGKIPPDEVANAPFVYRRTDAGYQLYSTGMDGVDQNGEKDDLMIAPEKRT